MLNVWINWKCQHPGYHGPGQNEEHFLQPEVSPASPPSQCPPGVTTAPQVNFVTYFEALVGLACNRYSALSLCQWGKYEVAATFHEILTSEHRWILESTALLWICGLPERPQDFFSGRMCPVCHAASVLLSFSLSCRTQMTVAHHLLCNQLI